MKLKNKIILAIGTLSVVALPTILLASCSKTPESDNNPNDKPITPPEETPSEPQPPIAPEVLEPTISKNELDKANLSFEQTIEKNAFKINKQWILDNKTKLLDGDTSLFTNANDISEFSARPSNDDETKLDINFTLKAGKSRAENKEPTTVDTSYKVIVTNFETPMRTLETLSELLNNFLSTKIRPKDFSIDNNKYIRINKTPGFENSTREVLRKWTQSKFGSNTIDLGSSTVPNCIWSAYGWDESQSNSSDSAIWKWLENVAIPNGDIYSYMNNLLKEYKYISNGSKIKSSYFYWKLIKKEIDETSNSNIKLHRWELQPVGWGFRILNDNGSEDVTINNGIKIPNGGDFIDNSFIPNKPMNTIFQFKEELGGETGIEETIGFTPNFVVVN